MFKKKFKNTVSALDILKHTKYNICIKCKKFGHINNGEKTCRSCLRYKWYEGKELGRETKNKEAGKIYPIGYKIPGKNYL